MTTQEIFYGVKETLAEFALASSAVSKWHAEFT